MITFIWIVAGIVAFIVLLFFLLWLNAIRASGKRDRKLDERIEPALKAVEGNSSDVRDVIMGFAEDSATRNHLFFRLKELGKEDLFPVEYRILEMVAESDLVRWLMHPNELSNTPSEIELVQKFPVKEVTKNGTCFLYKFRSKSPDWASKIGWMAGVAGPYWEDESPDAARGTFSEFKPFDEMTEEEHVEFLKNALFQKGLVVPS